MKVVTFYSFRGGVGRSLAVANVAHAMVESGERRVLVVDFDLEAPGLSFMDFMQPEKPAQRGGLFEFMTSYQARRAPDLVEYINPVKGKSPNLYFMAAGDLRRGYDVSGLDIERLLNPKRRRGNFVDHFRAQVESLGFHYVLIDSRTGLTELGGMCTVALPDLVILLTGLNRQNLEGTRWVLQNIRTRGRDPEEAIVVFSHLPDSEEDLKASRMEEALQSLQVKQKPVFLSYHPRMSLVEELFAQRWPGTRLAEAYGDLAEQIYGRNEEDLQSLIRKFSYARKFAPGMGGFGREDADESVRRALSLYPKNKRLLREIGMMYIELRRHREGIAFLERYIRSSDQLLAEERQALLRTAIEAGDRQAISREMNRIRCLFRRRGARAHRGEDLFQLYRLLGPVVADRAIQSGRLEKSIGAPILNLLIEIGRSLLRRAPRARASVYAHLVREELLLHYYEPEANHPRAALRYAERARELDPGFLAYNMACALALLGRRDRALEVLRGLDPPLVIHADPKTDKDWKKYWNDPEFQKILATARAKTLRGEASRVKRPKRATTLARARRKQSSRHGRH